MAILAFLGFDHMPTNSAAAYYQAKLPASSAVSGVITIVGGPYGGSAGAWSSNTIYITCAYVNEPYAIVQFDWYRDSAANSCQIIQFLDGATVQCNLYWNVTSSKLEFRRGTTVLATSTATVSSTTWANIKIKATVHGTTGAVQVYINGVLDIDVASLDTTQSANNYLTGVKVGSDSFISRYANLVFLDSQGAQNAFLGSCRVYTKYPDGAGNYTQFTPSAGSNYQCVDEATFNSDTDYVSSTTTNHIDSYTFGNIPTTVNVLGVAISGIAKKDDAGDTNGQLLVRGGTTDSLGSSIALGAGYETLYRLLLTDPVAAAAWTPTNVNAYEYGFKKVA